jgi:hypothetical protein
MALLQIKDLYPISRVIFQKDAHVWKIGDLITEQETSFIYNILSIYDQSVYILKFIPFKYEETIDQPNSEECTRLGKNFNFDCWRLN